MAKPPSRRSTRTASLVPAPSDNLDHTVTRMVWPKGQTIHRIHPNLYEGTAFNPGLRGNARFSPIKARNADRIPTVHGGTSFDCAAMETVFHDVPFAPGLKTYDKRKLEGHVYSQLTPRRDITLADLATIALRKIGIKRNQLFDTEKDRYPEARAWAAAIHSQCLDVQGLCWVSRQDDGGRALILFGDRVADKLLNQAIDSRDITADLDVYSDLLVLADRIGLKIVVSRR